MPDRFARSLIFRSGLMLAAIVLLALVSIVASVVVADRMEGDAEAINIAGSLRMQSYRIGLLVDAPPAELAAAVANFQQRLAAPVLAQTVANTADPDLTAAWAALQQRWQDNLRPLLLTTPVQREPYLARVVDFVADADHFVRRLQYASEAKIRMLRVVQGLTMFLTLALVFGAMYGLHADVITPLYALVTAARATGRGDFTVRVEHTTDDELGVLGQAFNTMADDLSRAYRELEQRVSDQTAELQRNNNALVMLYRMSALMSQPGNVQSRLPEALGMIATTLTVHPTFIGEAVDGGDFRIVTPAGEFPSVACQPGRTDPARRDGDGMAPRQVNVFPVQGHSQVFGQLAIETAGTPLDAWTGQVMRSAAEIIATALSLAAQEESQRRILLMEERAVIARELHDSLAQALSYLKIQVSRLDAQLVRGADHAEVQGTLDDLRAGLNNAYRQLRELLTTFRLRIDGAGLEAALVATVEEFHFRGLEVQVDYRLQHCPLAANEEIHVLQAVREALANVSRHAHASRALVLLHQRADGHVEAVVADDGAGMPPHPDKRQHHGLAIMRERAATLGGSISWSPVTPHGTRVTLEFRPAYFNA